MARLASGIAAALAAAVIAFAPPARGAEPKAERKGDGRPAEAARKKGETRLGEVEILGSAEHPQVLFFLPKSKFRLLPLRSDEEAKKTILVDDKVKRTAPE